MRLVLIAVLFAMSVTKSAGAAELGRFPMDEEAGFEFVVTAEPGLNLNQMAVFTVRIIPKDSMLPLSVTDMGFDARMPEHNHGMVVKPKIREIGLGEYRIEGVKLHMSGAWVLNFSFKKGRHELSKQVAWQLP